MLEEYAGIPVEVDLCLASFDIAVGANSKGTAVIAVSQPRKRQTLLAAVARSENGKARSL